ncbi:hypothetical protein [Cellulomonas sp.]|uniref:hypothetical protein n=1 Tax=Cellulomonas sp. TaxID=40001 RepID=UPI002812024C|nr:hypothetical protein [Cellulomonas sp.]
MSWHSDDGSGTTADRTVEVWPDDDRLAEELGDALRDAELAERVAAAGRAALAAHRREAAERDDLALELFLLTLVHDSELAGGPVGVRDRSGSTSRTLVFEGDGVGVEVELQDGQVEGQLVPAQAGRVTVRRPDGDVAVVDTDEVGWFHLDARPHGPVRLVCESTRGTCVTEWLSW